VPSACNCICDQMDRVIWKNGNKMNDYGTSKMLLRTTSVSNEWERPIA